MAYRKIVWSSAKTDAVTAQKLATHINTYLSAKNQVEVISITEDWWALLGTDESKRKLDLMISIANRPKVESVAS